MILGIDGQFGSGKTSLAVYLANKHQGENVVFWTNVQMNRKYIKNVVNFSDDELISALRSINFVNDVERSFYTHEVEGNSIKLYERNKFTKHILILDEAGAIVNGRLSKDFDNVMTEYVNQNRKMFCDIYIVTADGGQSDKSLRRFCDWWFYSKPFSTWCPILKDFKVIRRQKRQQDGVTIVEEPYLARDDQGDWVVKKMPIDEFELFYYQPAVFKYYDDLHKNIADPMKHVGLLRHGILDFFGTRKYEIPLTVKEILSLESPTKGV